MRSGALGASILVGSLLWASSAMGQAPAPTPSLDLRGFHASTDPGSGLYLEPADSPNTGEWNVGMWTNYSFRPVSLEAAPTGGTTPPTFHVINHQLTGDVVAAIGLYHRVLVGIDIPFLVYQTGDTPTADTTRATGSLTLPRQALGDVGLDVKTTLIRPTAGELGGFALALHERLTLPTGDEQSFLGEGAPSSETRLLGEFRAVAVGIHAALGVKFRGEKGSFGCGVNLEDCPSRFEHEIPFGLGLTLRPQALGIDPKGRLMFFVETHGYVPLAPEHPFQSQAASEAQLDLGARVAFGSVSVLAGFEKGLLQGVGTPNVRGVLAISWAPRVHDRDGDGIPDDVDQCPELAEDFDGFQDADGCPDNDNDDDGVPDKEDACPNQAGPENPDPKKNGCPLAAGEKPPAVTPVALAAKKSDRDGDGIPDELDACPDVAGPASTDPKQNGCPDPDQDHDTFVGADDKCPNEAEDFNGFEDEDGCPDATKKEAVKLPPLVVVRIKAGVPSLDVGRKVALSAAGDAIDPASMGVARAIASELSKHPTWVVTVGVRSKPNQDVAIAKKTAETIAGKLSALARRPGAAVGGEWKDVKNANRVEEFGVGFTVSDSANKGAAPP